MKIAKRVENLSPSITIAINALAKKLQAEGKSILNFSAGEPDFETPEGIKKAAIKAINNGHTKYTAVEGISEAKYTIIKKLNSKSSLNYKVEDIVISNGAKHCLFNLFQVLLDKGDEVIIPTPCWVTYPEQVKYSRGIPVFIETDELSKFKITPKQLKSVISSKTKILLLNSPSNPTGAIYSREELLALGKVLERTNILVISDEIYEQIIYEEKEFTSVSQISKDMFNRTVLINGLSKSVAMTGWRFGYIATPIKDIISAIITLQGQTTSNVNSITQYSSIALLDKDTNKDIDIMKVEFEKRRNYAYENLNKISNISCLKPDGAFYLFVNIQKITNDSALFCINLLEKEGVALIPGVSFKKEGYFRFSFATDLELIKEGIRKIKSFINEYY